MRKVDPKNTNPVLAPFIFKMDESQLRDHFAGLAMQALIGNIVYDPVIYAHQLAENAYKIADAMIEKGEK